MVKCTPPDLTQGTLVDQKTTQQVKQLQGNSRVQSQKGILQEKGIFRYDLQENGRSFRILNDSRECIWVLQGSNKDIASFEDKHDSAIESSPAIDDGDNSRLVDSNLLVSGNSHVEMLERHVAPSTVVVGQIRVGRTEVGCRHSHRSFGYTPSRLVAFDLKACPTAQAVVEEGRAQSCCVRSIALAIQVSIPASTSCDGDIFQKHESRKQCR
jgi:hypothetical protein